MSETAASAPLPPGQVVTGKFPVVGETAPRADYRAETLCLQVEGAVARPLRLPFAQLAPRLQRERRCDIHCVTGWTRPAMTLTGLPLAELLAEAVPLPAARYVRFIAGSPRAHDTSLPLALALEDCWLVAAIDGQPLSREHGGPLRTVTPSRYFYKSLKWLERIELLAEDQLGYWERESAYHNEARPEAEQRFDESRVADAAVVAALRAATDLAPFRGQVLLKARLGGWQPASRDLRGLQLKYSSLRQARLAGCDLRESNFSLSNLEGADLREADLSGADLEGASLAGADLRGARADGAFLSATRFFRDFSSGKRLAAQVQGLSLRRCSGLLESQEAFLREQGARFE
ncbi:MAG TPA: molybdopterin-dependent oxidoreductase [Nevskiaceae bacterium]|nr:molybdopterin-dependent oxidoreductase [Nevskiaceae bacterium]